MVRPCGRCVIGFCLVTATTIAATTAVGSATSKAGPASGWMVKLSAGERDEISRKCSSSGDDGKEAALFEMPTNANTSEHNKQRLYNGQLASPGMFRSSAVLVSPRPGYPYLAVCGASLISPRHLLTASHCVKGTVAGYVFPIRLLAGGVCTDAVPSEACPSGNMAELEIDFTIKEYFFFTKRDGRLRLRNPYDLAIIQLKRPLSAYLPPKRAEFACLPYSNDADRLPTSLSAWGWGLRGGGQYEPPTIHQRYLAGLYLRPPASWTGDLLSDMRCRLPPSPTFCLFSPGSAPQVTLPGDSGSGVIAYLGQALVNILYGVQTSSTIVFYATTPNGTVQRREIGVAEAPAHYLDDLCYYLGLCANSNGLTTRLQLGSVMLTREPRSALPPIAPFRMVPETEQAKHEEYCEHLPSPTPPLTWAMGLVEMPAEGGVQDPERVLCTATLISSAHLVASRRCIADYLRGSNAKGGHGGAVAKSRLRLIASEYEFCYRPSASGPSCAGVREGRHRVFVLRPEFITWRHVSAGRHNSTTVSYTNISSGVVINLHDYRAPYTIDSDLALIQLGVEDAAKLATSEAIKPACLEKDLLSDYGEDKNEKRLGTTAYGVSIDPGVDKGVAWLRGRVGRQWDGMLSDVLRVERDSEREARYASAWQRGAGLLDTRSHRLLGLLLDQGEGQRFHYVHLWEYADVLCTFLGMGCRPNSAGVTYLDNRIAAFDRFVYVD